MTRTMTTKPPRHVIILAQGKQKRLPDLKVPKQMLELPECGGELIIDRTLCQLAMILPSVTEEIDQTTYVDNVSVTVVCDHPLKYHVDASGKSGVYNTTRRVMSVGTIKLPDPGNSSLKGISRFFDDQDGPASLHPDFETVVLLGDVIYSWACLKACMTPTQHDLSFTCSSDISNGHGELWGLMWKQSARPRMMKALAAALRKHPPFTEYQPGQMRRWLWEIDISMGKPSPRAGERTWMHGIDDYTRDIDTPQHVSQLRDLSAAAAADDREHGLVWRERE
jgi:hypothetical protein